MRQDTAQDIAGRYTETYSRSDRELLINMF